MIVDNFTTSYIEIVAVVALVATAGWKRRIALSIACAIYLLMLFAGFLEIPMRSLWLSHVRGFLFFLIIFDFYQACHKARKTTNNQPARGFVRDRPD
jgi:hypothetical protein